jgi:hypothetical protein
MAIFPLGGVLRGLPRGKAASYKIAKAILYIGID